VFDPVKLETSELTMQETAASLTMTASTVRGTAASCNGGAAAAVPPRPGPLPAAGNEFDGEKRRSAFAIEAWSLLKDRQYEKLDALAAEARTRKTDPVRPDIEVFYDAVGRRYAELTAAEHIARVREWVKARPQSAAARVTLAFVLYNAAWERRGAGFSDSVSTPAADAFQAGLRDAQRALQEGATIAANEPQYQVVRLLIEHDVAGADPRAVVREAAKTTPYPALFRYTSTYLTDKWGGGPEPFRAFAEEAARLTSSSFGADGMYAYLAYQAWFNVHDWDAYRFDRERVRRGCQQIIDAGPKWVPAYHRCAFIASELLHDRSTAREFFKRPELGWYEGAFSMWRSRTKYDDVRAWALGTPAEPFIETKPPVTSPSAAVVTPSAKWPNIVMQNELTRAAGIVQRQFASFLVEVPGGVVAVSAVPRSGDGNAPQIEAARNHTSWTMFPPAAPSTVLRVASFQTKNARPNQLGVALTLAPFKGDPPVHPLKMSKSPAPMRVLIVGCGWNAGRCQQTVIEGSNQGRDLAMGATYGRLSISIPAGNDAAALIGSAVLNEDGLAVAVVVGPSLMTTTRGGVFIAADELGAVVTP
jgi:hypothetical protein